MTWEIDFQGWYWWDHWKLVTKPWGTIWYLGPFAVYRRKVIRL